MNLRSWLKGMSKPSSPPDWRLKYAEMPDEEFVSISPNTLNDAAKQCYEEIRASKHRYLEMSDAEFAALDAETQGDAAAARCYRNEATRRARIGDFLVKVTVSAEVDAGFTQVLKAGVSARFGPISWPQYCVQCNSNHIYATLQLGTTFKYHGNQFSLRWSVPICGSCYQSRDSHCVGAWSTEGLLAVEHVFAFTNYSFGARFKEANRGRPFVCPRCNQEVGRNPYRPCPNCGARSPVSKDYILNCSKSASFVCGDCKVELSDDAIYCPRCRLKQPPRALS